MSDYFNEIVVIYNPISTGSSESNAKEFSQELSVLQPNQKITLIKTKYKGHAEKVASKYSTRKGNWLIVSSSGDGGYNEVINGILRGKKTGLVVASVLPSGNANDHHAAMTSDDLLGNIKRAKVEKIDVIKVESVVDSKPWVRYAHSYVGFGITPKVGRELTIRQLNAFNEKWYVLRSLLAFKHVKLNIEGANRQFSSLVFATIPKMSKVIRLADDASQRDGKMEMYQTKYLSPIGMLKLLSTVVTKGMKPNKRLSNYHFSTVNPTLIQLDGEVTKLDKDSEVIVSCLKQELHTII